VEIIVPQEKPRKKENAASDFEVKKLYEILLFRLYNF